MTDALAWLLVLPLLVNVVLLVFVLLRLPRGEKTNAWREELRAGREEANRAARDSRDEISRGLRDANDTLSSALTGIASMQRTQLEAMTEQIQKLSQTNHSNFDRLREVLDEKLAQNRQELSDGLTAAKEMLSLNLNDLWQVQRIQLKDFAESNQTSIDGVRLILDSRVKELQDSNEKKLDEMRKTVDEKLHETLEKRLGASFNVVSERLEAVQRGLGEMQNLAAGVGDLQRVLTNVKVRGTWAEVQLGNLLDQILAPGQYEKNVRIKPDSSESVEYAVRLLSKGGELGNCLWLPIDSKFPQESYRRLQEAADRADPEATKKLLKPSFVQSAVKPNRSVKSISTRRQRQISQ